jgi:predicted DNA-binding protein
MADQRLSDPVSLRLPHSLVEALKQLARADHRTLSAYIRLLLEQYVEDHR